ncbi:MAG: YqjF family protein [Vicinamibacterales bacterium]
MGDFNDGIVVETDHRPWPMPHAAWVMTQTWNDLLFAHWPADARVLRSLVPSRFDLDTFDSEAWIGVVPFSMTNVVPRFVPPLPWFSAFPELNVRTYVRVADKPGVYFFSLDAANAVAVGAARTLLNLPYYTADMQVQPAGDGVQCTSRRLSEPAARFEGRYRGLGSPHPPAAGTLEYFLTERYCLYAIDRRSRPYRLDIHHPPWLLEPADAEIAANSMASSAGIELPSTAPLLHFSKRQDAVAWPPESI